MSNLPRFYCPSALDTGTELSLPAGTARHVQVLRLQPNDEITLFNHLELPVFEKYLLLPVLKEWLLKLPEVITVWMSGSGSTMVALLNQELSWEQNQRLQTTIRTTFGEYFWIKSVTFLT